MDEKIFYNAVAIAAHGDYKKIEKWHAGHGTWEETYRSTRNAWLAADDTLFGEADNTISEKAREAREERQRMLSVDPRAEWQKVVQLGMRLILLDDEDYPPLLREIPHPPFGIYVLGDLNTMNGGARVDSTPLSLSIVGTRRATPEGGKIAQQFGRELARVGFTIVSGLAFGIDAAAHEGYLEGAAGGGAVSAVNGASGKAIAVLAGGLDDVYPHSNEALARRILAAGGAIVSEYPIGEPPLERRFLERNRIISGLSRGTLIVEAPERSGSLATARYAFEQNRDLFIIPGSIAHPNFAASHELIRQGATLVTKPEHIMEAYGVTAADKTAANVLAFETSSENGAPDERLIMEALRDAGDALEVDKLADITRLEPQAVNQAITFLVIKNLVKEVAGGYIIEYS